MEGKESTAPSTNRGEKVRIGRSVGHVGRNGDGNGHRGGALGAPISQRISSRTSALDYLQLLPIPQTRDFTGKLPRLGW
jgi:hypothetical protein